jgi:glycosidase
MLMNNHDAPRSATRFYAAKDDQQLKVAAAMLLTIRETPFLYQGEEIGMRDIHLSHSEFRIRWVSATGLFRRTRWRSLSHAVERQ